MQVSWAGTGPWLPWNDRNTITWDEIGKPQLCITKLTVRENTPFTLNFQALDDKVTQSFSLEAEGNQVKGHRHEESHPGDNRECQHLYQPSGIWRRFMHDQAKLSGSRYSQALLRSCVTGQGRVRALKQGGCILNQTTEKQEGGRMGREEEKSFNENLITTPEYKIHMSKWMW